MEKRQGFTLVELVVVVMILGILAAVAAPKLLGTSGTATDNGLRQTLSVVRDAIERYAAENGGDFPGTDEATFKTADCTISPRRVPDLPRRQQQRRRRRGRIGHDSVGVKPAPQVGATATTPASSSSTRLTPTTATPPVAYNTY